MEIRAYARFSVHEQMIFEVLTCSLVAASSVNEQEGSPQRTVWPTKLSGLLQKKLISSCFIVLNVVVPSFLPGWKPRASAMVSQHSMFCFLLGT